MAKTMYDAVVVGGGASGMLAAIFAARAGSNVLILEQKDVLCKKIHATGNGKCNFTNKNWKEEYFRSDAGALAIARAGGFPFADTLSFFHEIGIFPREKNGYYYPASEQAASVANALILEAKRLGVHSRTGVCVTGIQKTKNGNFLIFGGEESFTAKSVVLAAGGCASPVHGSDGSGYALARTLGHTVLSPLPAIVSLKAEGSFFKTLAGVRLQGSIRLHVKGFPEKKDTIYEECGELLFAAYGISGIPVMQVSRYATAALAKGQEVTAELNLFPMLSKEELTAEIEKRFSRMLKNSAEEALCGLCNHKLNYVVLKQCGIPPEGFCAGLGRKHAKTVAEKLTSFCVKITGSTGFENAQACAGGVPLTELSSCGESLFVPGLFLTGELCDVDGACGGYNLQWAWSSGAQAGKEIGGRYASNTTTKD